MAAPKKGYIAQTGAQHRLNAQEDPAIGLPTVPLDHDTGIDLAEVHFDPISVVKVELWFGDRALPTWAVPDDGSGEPPIAAALNIGDAVQFRVAVYDRHGLARWLSISQLLTARPEFHFTFVVSDDTKLSPDADTPGLFLAKAAAAPTIKATIDLNGTMHETQLITVTIS